MITLAQVLSQIQSIEKDRINWILNAVENQQFEKGTILQREGSIKNKIFFVSHGYLRTFQNIDGKLRTINFAKPGMFVTSSLASNFSEKSQESIETISKARITSLTTEKFEQLIIKIPQLSFLMNKVLQEVLECKERRIRQFINFDSRDRYKWFVEHNPELARVVSVNHLSSYLGVAPETISRIRAKVIF